MGMNPQHLRQTIGEQVSGQSIRQIIEGFLPGMKQEDRELRAALAESAQLNRTLEASKAEARSRLKKVLTLYGVKLKPVEGDGNCQFRALSLALHGTQAHHPAMRERAVRQL